jgi:hypothetical protein
MHPRGSSPSQTPSITSGSNGGLALRPEGDRAALAGRVGAGAHVGGSQSCRRRRAAGCAAEVLRAGDAAVPERRAAHRTPQGVLGRRRGRALPPPHRQAGPAPDGLRRLRPPCREPRDKDGAASARVHRRRDPVVPAPVPRVGNLHRLVPGVRHARAALLPLDAVDLPAAVRARTRLPQGGGGQVVPERPDGARERAGRRRALRALRSRGRGQAARAMVLPHHRLRGPAARGPRRDRLARARQDDAAQLDRPVRGRRGAVPLRGARDRLSRLHDTTRHALRRDVLRHGAGASRRLQARGGHRARARRPR